MAEQANWYVAHTYSGYENKVATDLMTMVENRHLQGPDLRRQGSHRDPH